MEKKNATVSELDNLLPHFVITDILMYAASSCVLVVNGGIVVIFLVQRLRRTAHLSPISPAGILVLNLLVSDALVGALGIAMTAFYNRDMTRTRYGCATRIAVRYLFRMGAHMALINVALDRYIAIMHTLHYREWVTMERSLALIAFGWLVPVWGVVYVFAENDWSPGIIFCSQIASFSNFLTYIRLPSHLAAILTVFVIQCRIYIQLRNYKQVSAHQALRQYSHKSARALFWVTSSYVVCWLPFDVMLLAITFDPRRSFKIIFDATVVLAHSSFLVNAFIFSYKTENIRKPVSVFCWDVWRHVTCRTAQVAMRAGSVASTTLDGGGGGGGGGGVARHGSTDTSASHTTVSTSVSSQLKRPSSAIIINI